MTVDLGAVPNPIPQGLPNLGEGRAAWYLFTSGTTATWDWREVGEVGVAFWVSGKESLTF